MVRLRDVLKLVLLADLALIVRFALGEEPPKPAEFALRPQRQFLQLPAGLTLGACSAVAVNSHDEVYLFHRGPHPILCFDANGKLLRSWGDDVIQTAHGLRVDREDNVWVTDIGSHRVHKFDPQGKLLLTLGTGQRGTQFDQFDKPTDIAFGPDAEVYVTDGYGNSRVMKFTAAGQFVSTWGTPGQGPGQFHLPHSIVIDAQGRVYVGDRENNRIQIFDGSGKLLDIWPGFAPYGLAFDRDGRLFVADGRAAQVLMLSETGRVQRRIGRPGTGVGEFQMPHMLGLDADGNLFVAEVNGQRMQKFLRVATGKSKSTPR